MIKRINEIVLKKKVFWEKVSNLFTDINLIASEGKKISDISLSFAKDLNVMLQNTCNFSKNRYNIDNK